MKKIFVPHDAAHLQEWITKLQQAQCPYELVSHYGKTAILLEEAFAQDILGLELLPPAPPEITTWNWHEIQGLIAGLFQKGSWVNRAVGGILVIGLLLYLPTTCDDTPRVEEPITQEEVLEETPAPYKSLTISAKERAMKDSILVAKAESDLKEQLEREIASFNKTFDNSGYRGSAQLLQLELVVFAVWAKLIKESETSNNNAVKANGERLERKVKSLQAKEFPKLREAYADIAQELFLDADVDVRISGKTKSTLHLTGYDFINDVTIKKVQRDLDETLTQFRFKRINYKWSQHSDEYKYYDMDTPKDSEVVE